MTEETKHIEQIDNLIQRASIQGDLSMSETEELAMEVTRLRRVIARLTPFMVSAVEETVAYAEELEDSGVDPTEPALAGLRETINRLRIVFKA